MKQSAETVRQSIKAVLARTIQIVYKSFVKFHLYLIFLLYFTLDQHALSLCTAVYRCIVLYQDDHPHAPHPTPIKKINKKHLHVLYFFFYNGKTELWAT